ANDAKLSQSLAQQSCEAFENWFLDPSCRHSEFPSDAGPRHVEIGGEFARVKWALLDVADHESRDDLCILTLFGAAFVVGVGTLAKPARHFHAEKRNDEVFLSELHRREATPFQGSRGRRSATDRPTQPTGASAHPLRIKIFSAFSVRSAGAVR